MTTEPSPGQGAPQENVSWAFRPRRPVNAELRGEPQEAQPSLREDDQRPPQQSRSSYGETWEAAVPHQEVPATRSAVQEATPEPDPWRPRQAQIREQADHGFPHSPAAAAVLDLETVPFPESAAGQPQRGRGKRAGRIALALAVLAAAGGAAAVMLKPEDSAAVASKQLARVWQVPAPAADDELLGSWLTDKLFIRASTRGGVRAYGLADGSEVWSAAPTVNTQQGGTSPCAISPTLTAQGLGTVAFGKDSNSCTSLAGIDTATGKILWTTPLVDSRHPTAMAAETYLQGDVATIVSENFLGGLDVRTGRRVWGFHTRGYYCSVYDWGADGIVLVDDYCADSSDKFTFTAYDGKTGKVLWTKSQGAHTDLAHVFSGSPLIASLHTASEDSVRVFAPTGRSRKLAVGNTEVMPGNDAAADHSARLIGNVLVTPAQAADGNEIDGFDTTTGARLWSYRSAALATATAGDDRVYAVSTSGSPQLVQLDPRTGHAIPVAGLPAGMGNWNFTTGTVYVTPDGGVLELNALGTGGGVRLYR